jgi:hypothetical protein
MIALLSRTLVRSTFATLRGLCIALLLALPSAAQAQFTSLQWKPAVAPAYTGPGDIVSGASMWWGLRAYSSATHGTKAVNLRNGGVCADVNSDASTGAVPNAPTINGAACDNAGHPCTVKTLYDQSGNGNDITQATTSQQPSFSISCLGSLPCMKFARSANTTLLDATSTVVNQGFTLVAAAERTGSTTSQSNFIGSSSLGGYYFMDSANSVAVYAGSFTSNVTANDNTWHALQSFVITTGSGNPTITVDGVVSNPTSPGSGNLTAGAGLSSDTAKHCDCSMTEGGVWPSDFSSGNKTSMNSNIHTFWGF